MSMSSRNGRPQDGGQRTESEPNRAPKWITEFFKEFLSSAKCRHNLKRRNLAGDANHMEILGHNYAFGNPRKRVVVDPPPPKSPIAEGLQYLTKAEMRLLGDLLMKMESAAAGQAGPSSTLSGSPPTPNATRGGLR
jgi:hypothetical protein